MQEKIDKYLAWKSTHHFRASVMYRKALERLVEICGEKKIEEYTIDDIVYYTGILSKKYANETIRFSLAIVKNFFTYYNSLKYDCLPTKLIELPRKLPANSHRAIKPFEFEQLMTFEREWTFPALRDACISCLLWDTGVRVSELSALDLEEIDTFSQRAITPTRKTSDARIIMWSERTNHFLIRYRYVYKQLEIPALENGRHPLFISLGKNGLHTRLTTRSIERIIVEIGKKAGLERRIKPHMFRHGWAHARRDIGAPLSFIQKGLGHRSPISTQTYQQFGDPEFVNAGQQYFQRLESGVHLVNFPSIGKVEELTSTSQLGN